MTPPVAFSMRSASQASGHHRKWLDPGSNIATATRRTCAMTRMATGFDKPLYVLPFDHRGTFKKNMFGWSGTLTTEQTDQIVSFKQVIYEALQVAVGAGVPRETAGVLLDEQFGAAILRDAT